MKKLLLMTICALSFYFLGAQVSEDFTDYEVGGKIAEQAQAMGRNYWTTWSNNPGSAEDGIVGEVEGNKTGNILPNNDLVLLLGNQTQGIWDFSMDVYVPNGKVGYFNILSKFAGSGSQWAMQVYFNAINDGGQNPTTPNPTQGCIHAGAANAAQFTCAYDTWMHVKVTINLDIDQATFYVNDEQIHQWQYTAGSFGNGGNLRRIDAMDIYASPEDNMEFSVDNIVFEHVGGGAPVMSVTPTNFEVALQPGTTSDETATVTNSGNSIGDYHAWITFDAATTVSGDGVNDLTYNNNTYGTSIGFASGSTPLIEIAAKYTGDMYGNVMGTEIIQAAYFVSSPVQAGIKFRIYDQGSFLIPGEVLTEAEISTPNVGDWNIVTFPQPVFLKGQDVWVSVEFTQTGAEQEYPISSDNGAAGKNTNWIRTNGGAWSQMTQVGNPPSDIGCWMIGAITHGDPVLGSWVKLTGDNNSGSLQSNGSTDLTLHFDVAGLADNEKVYAKLNIATNDENNPLFELPISLEKVVGISELSDLTTIYPNPANAQVVIEEKNFASVSIFNLSGQLIETTENKVVNTTGYEEGIYLFKVTTTEGNTFAKPIVIKH